MRALLQRVTQVQLSIENELYSEIGSGLLVLLGIEEGDTQDDIDWLVKKVVNLRVFNDASGKMNYSLLDVKGEVMVVSQFTLHANTKKGNRPSYVKAAKPELAIPLYESFIRFIGLAKDGIVKTGKFGADMQISLTNDGPVTIWLDSKQKD